MGVLGTVLSESYMQLGGGGGYECTSTGMVQVNITFNKIRLGFCYLFVFSIELVINE